MKWFNYRLAFKIFVNVTDSVNESNNLVSVKIKKDLLVHVISFLRSFVPL